MPRMNRREKEIEREAEEIRKVSIVIRVDRQVYEELRRRATPFTDSERGTPNKVLRSLLDFDED